MFLFCCHYSVAAIAVLSVIKGLKNMVCRWVCLLRCTIAVSLYVARKTVNHPIANQMHKPDATQQKMMLRMLPTQC